MSFQGINAHTEDLLRDSSQVSLVKEAGLVLFCWGDDNNDLSTIRHLKDLGLHAIIYDRLVLNTLDVSPTLNIEQMIFF